MNKNEKHKDYKNIVLLYGLTAILWIINAIMKLVEETYTLHDRTIAVLLAIVWILCAFVHYMRYKKRKIAGDMKYVQRDEEKPTGTFKKGNY